MLVIPIMIARAPRLAYGRRSRRHLAVRWLATCARDLVTLAFLPGPSPARSSTEVRQCLDFSRKALPGRRRFTTTTVCQECGEGTDITLYARALECPHV